MKTKKKSNNKVSKLKESLRRIRGEIKKEKSNFESERGRIIGDIASKKSEILHLESEIARLSDVESDLYSRIEKQTSISGKAYALISKELLGIKHGSRISPKSDTVAAYDFTPNDRAPVMYMDWLNVGLKTCSKEKIIAILMSDKTSKLCFGCDGINTYGTTPIIASRLMGDGLVIVVEKKTRK